MMEYMILCPVLQNRPPFPRSKDSHRLDIDVLTSRTSSCFWMWRWALQWSHTCDTWHSPATPSRGLRPRGSRDARTHGRLVTATITHRLISHLRPGTVGVACPGKSELALDCICIGHRSHDRTDHESFYSNYVVLGTIILILIYCQPYISNSQTPNCVRWRVRWRGK